MKPVTLPGDFERPIVVDLCEACRCVFIEYFDGDAANIARALQTESLMQAEALTDLSRPADAYAGDEYRDPPHCPECDVPMQLMLYLEQGPPVHRCNQCMATLATARQVAALARYEELEETAEVKSGGLFGFLRRYFY